MAKLPLLVFPKANIVQPPKGHGGSSKPHTPSRELQGSRLSPQFQLLQQQFAADNAFLAKSIAGIEPEMVLVIETAGRIEDFQRAIANTGLEWLAEWDDEFAADDDFYNTNDKGERTAKPVASRLFLSMCSQRGLDELLSLWNQWKIGNDLPYGKAKWRDIFAQLKDIRRWGIQEQLIDSGMLEIWEEDLQYEAQGAINFQIEFFYRKQKQQRLQNESQLRSLLEQLSGSTISPFVDYEAIGFHAVKAILPRASVQVIVEKVRNHELDIGLLKLPNIMFFRPTGQALTSSPNESQGIEQAPDAPVSGDPIVAILDGVPFSQHDWLKNRLLVDDPGDLEAHYQPGEKKHGTAMASLVVHGELDAHEPPLARPVYFHPILQPDPKNREREESVPDEVLAHGVNSVIGHKKHLIYKHFPKKYNRHHIFRPMSRSVL